MQPREAYEVDARVFSDPSPVDNLTVTVGVSLDGDAVKQGREIYLAEGCFYCHTQEVRDIVTDVGLGAVSLAGDYANEAPAPRGVQRIGPDLMHYGQRTLQSLVVPGDAENMQGAVDAIIRHLENPRGDYEWSLMPEYTYLSPTELNQLAAYLLSLQ